MASGYPAERSRIVRILLRNLDFVLETGRLEKILSRNRMIMLVLERAKIKWELDGKKGSA